MSGHLAWLLMLLMNILSECGRQPPPKDLRYSSYEVIMPKKLTPRYGRVSQNLKYLLKIKGKNQIIHLTQNKGIVPKVFPIFTYSKKGDLQVDYPFIRDDCYYDGFVQGKLLSSVILNTCSGGLRGLLHLENQIYEIKPVPESTSFQHIVYHLEQNKNATHMRCAVVEEKVRLQQAIIQKAKHVEPQSVSGDTTWAHTRYAKVAVVVDHERYVKLNRNDTAVAVEVLEIIHTANSFFQPLALHVAIAGLEIWSETNLINISYDIGSILSAFNHWRQNTLLKHLKNDAGHLFLNMEIGALGLAYTGSICSNQWASAVESFAFLSLYEFSVLFAHELGHILGMKHDGLYCTCNKFACIMEAYLVNSDKFSNCSYQDYFKFKDSHCLLIPPESDKLYTLEYCGNKVVENGEECDCGTDRQCQLDLCCQPNCKLHSGATCAFGQCCAQCQYRPAGSICRKKRSVCDLPEYCNGTSEWCPEDVYVQDGAPCSDEAHCYHGNCTTRTKLCKTIFGLSATVGSKACFRLFNMLGDRFGNCGHQHGIYMKCEAENALCGRIQCDNVHTLPSLEEHNTIIQSTLDGSQCWSKDYHFGMEEDDTGIVKDGASCGPGMMCMDGKCKSTSVLKYDDGCNATQCHNQGVCNNHKHCHCNSGWAPPDCIKKGYGGSIDSGPIFQARHNVIATTILGTATVVAGGGIFGFFVYYKVILRYQFRTPSAATNPTETL